MTAKKRIYILLILLSVSLNALCPPLSAKGENTGEPRFTVLYLGDDLINGNGLTSPQRERMSALVSKSLGAEEETWGIEGGTSKSLIDALNTGALDDLIKEASYIIISVGANDFLNAFREAADASIESLGYEFTLADFITDVYGKNTDSAAYKKSGAAVKQLSADLEYSNPVWAAAKNYTGNISLILSYIMKRSTAGKVVITNVYNPYAGLNALMSGQSRLDLRALGEKYISHMNTALSAYRYYGWRDLYLVDIQSVLSQDRMLDAASSSDNAAPRPTRSGHSALAKLIEGTLAFPGAADIKDRPDEILLRRAAAWGITAGLYKDGKLSPDAKLTRGDFARMLCLCAGGNAGWFAGQSWLKDVQKTDARSSYIYWSVNMGIIDYDYSGFRPDAVMTREQAASALWKYLIYRGISPTIEIDVEIKDLDSISENCRAAVEGLAVVGALSLDSKSNVNPTRTMSRAEAAAMLMRACEVTPLRRSAG
ncbi:MAG: S-layer homology domain-containing protein [Eubacteriales bacterium]|jgi:lysophospholipase L1-like esterase